MRSRHPETQQCKLYKENNELSYNQTCFLLWDTETVISLKHLLRGKNIQLLNYYKT